MPDTPKVTLEQSLQLQALEQMSEISSSLGILQGQMNLVLSEQQRAAEKRERMYEKLNKIDIIEQQLERIVPLVDKHEEHHNHRVGAVNLGRLIWGLLAGGAGAGILSLVEWLTGKATHH